MRLVWAVLLIAGGVATEKPAAPVQPAALRHLNSDNGSASNGNDTAHTGSQPQPELRTWRNYLLVNDSVQLEPCTAEAPPHAWRSSVAARQGKLQLPGTAAVQALIYDHQHPKHCSNASFLVYEHPGHLGLGALVDYLGDALAWALSENRVLLLDYPSRWTRGGHRSYCNGGALALDECYFEQVSSCTLRDVYGPEVVEAWGASLDPQVLQRARKQLHGDRILFNTVAGKEGFGQVPPQAAPFMGSIKLGLKVGGISSELFWWRAQGAAYITRLNARTLQAVAQLKREFFRNSTIPPGTVSVHVRRGAKTAIGEMRAVPDLVYFQYAQALRNGDKQLLKQSVFVSTEDPTAVKWFDKNATGWQVLYTTVPRDNHHGGAAPFEHAPTNEALRAFLNLDLALECDAWVGTLGSSWSTLMERLRFTVRCKADKPYADAHGTLAGLGSVKRLRRAQR